MTRTRNWHARAIYVIVALVMTLGLLLVPMTGSVLAQIDPDLFALEPSLALNVKGAIEKYTITYNGSEEIPAVNITQWRVTSNWMDTEATIVDGGKPGDAWIRVQATQPGEAHIFVDIDIDLDGLVDLTLDAEKKWGEIWCTELTSESMGWNNYNVTELVKGAFIWGAPGDVYEYLPADDAVVHWWLLDIDALTDADNLNEGVGILDVEADLGGDDPCDEDGGCGKWSWVPDVADEDQPNDPFNRINWLQDLYPVNHSEAYLWDGWPDTTINGDGDYATSTTMEDGTTGIGVYAASASSVLLVTLAEYPVDYHGENVECVQHETFKPVIPPEKVKSPQLRWAGEKTVLEHDWDVYPYFYWDHYYDWDIGEWIDSLEFHLYFAIYSLEEGCIGNLEPVMDVDKWTWHYEDWGDGEAEGEIRIDMDYFGLPAGAQQVICPLGGYYYEYDFDDWDYDEFDYGYGYMYDYTDSGAIFVSEQSGEADINVALYKVDMYIYNYEDYYMGWQWDDEEVYVDGPVDEHGFLLYYLEFEEVVLTDEDEGALTDITPASDLGEVPSAESVDVAVQVKGFFDYRHSHLMATTRDETLLDLDGDGEADVVLPAGRYVLPDDWWILAGTKDVSLRPNWDMMDMAHHDDVVSTDELGPYAPVAAADPLEEAEWPCIGPFSTLQGWSSDLMWITSATVPSSIGPWDYGLRNTVVPDGEDLNWYDAPMPQALVTFDIIDYDTTVDHSLSELDKGDLEGYGYVVDDDPTTFGTATSDGSTTTLIDATNSWTADELVGRTVCIVRAGTTYECIITDNTDTKLTFWPALPSSTQSGDEYFMKLFQSPFYEVEIPAHWQIPPGYDWLSWERDPAYWWGWLFWPVWGPYDYWTDLGIKSFPGDPEPHEINDQDVEVYCDNHGIAGVTVDPLVGQGTVTITATADYPYAPLRGKYGPRVSGNITVGGFVDLNPHFIVDDATPDVGQVVLFDPHTTTGGTMMYGNYQKARWDWEGDGTWDVTLVYGAADDPATTWDDGDPLALVSHAYPVEGWYWPCLEITDFSEPEVVRYECRGEDDPIIVGSAAPCEPEPSLAEGFASITDELVLVYYYEGAGNWGMYWPEFGIDTIGTLEVNEVYLIYVDDNCTLSYGTQTYPLDGSDWNYEGWRGC